MMDDEHDAIRQIVDTGNLPPWVPTQSAEEFDQLRRALLRRHGMTEESLTEAVTEVIEVHRKDFSADDYLKHERRGLTINAVGNPDYAGRDVAIVARIVQAAMLDEAEGLPLLIGTEAAAMIQATERRNKILAEGRLEGVKKRQETAEEQQTRLVKAIADLFDKPDKPGWTWTNDRIAAFLVPTFNYTSGTILQTVKREAAKHRKARKDRQASQFPKR